MPKTRICFVTAARSEFGLMLRTLQAIRRHPRLRLQVIATGMHLDDRHGRTLGAIADAGFKPDRVIAWPTRSGRSTFFNAQCTGRAIAALSQAYAEMKTDAVLVVGDRVEAFAAAAAAHLSHVPVAHVHGGDRAMGQIDDSLRHAITKLAHLHFPATAQSARRIKALGEEKWRIHRVGSPGIESIADGAASEADLARRFPQLEPRRYGILLLHPADADADVEYRRAELVLRAMRRAGIPRMLVIYPNNDPGCDGIIRCWQAHAADADLTICRDLPRAIFLGLMRDAAMLVGNSSSGIIEAASFGLPVVDIGRRQLGREHGQNVMHGDYHAAHLVRMIGRIWNSGRPRRFRRANPYAAPHTARRIAEILASLPPREKLLRKLITL